MQYNAHFSGKSSRKVLLTTTIIRDNDILDGAYFGWSNPMKNANYPDGEFQVVFDLPDFQYSYPQKLPIEADVQLNAFAFELTLFDNEKEFNESYTEQIKPASKCFIPHSSLENEDKPENKAECFFTGYIKEFEIKTNTITNQKFGWILADTLGGEIDIVFDLKLINKEPVVGGIVQGTFWLTGKIINT